MMTKADQIALWCVIALSLSGCAAYAIEQGIVLGTEIVVEDDGH